MTADVTLNGDTLELYGNVVAPESAIASKGALAGFVFYDRSNQNNFYVLHADKGKAFLWQNGVGNIFTFEGINSGATVTANQLIAKGKGPTGSILVKWDEQTSRVPVIGGQTEPVASKTVERQMDLVEMILDLQKTVSDLEKRLHNAEAKVGISTPIRIKR